jgi:dephospho-CoA kinase
MTRGQIIWVHGYPCVGKTFNADYLATLGWHNIDGDQLF